MKAVLGARYVTARGYVGRGDGGSVRLHGTRDVTVDLNPRALPPGTLVDAPSHRHPYSQAMDAWRTALQTAHGRTPRHRKPGPASSFEPMRGAA